MNLLRRLTASSLAVLLAVPNTFVWTAKGQELIPGFTYNHDIEQATAGQVESYTITASPSSTLYPIVIQGSGMIYGGGNINTAISRAEALGYQVAGAINSDYFSLSTGVPFGIVIENGIYKSSPNEYSSILFNGMETTVIAGEQIPISFQNNRSGETTKAYHLNKLRTSTGGLYVYTSAFASTTRTTLPGVMVRLVPTYDEIHSESGGQLRVHGTLSLTVAEVVETSEALTIGEHDIIIAAAEGSGYEEDLLRFAVGDSVTLQTSVSNTALREAQWATGGSDILIYDGVMTEPSTWTHTYEGRAPRTAFGVKEDGSLVLFAVDGRQSASIGMTETELAYQMAAEGCVYAVNLDGGGSTSFAVGSYDSNLFSPAILTNSPSDGTMRSCATYLLLVDPQKPNHLNISHDVDAVLVGSQVSLGSISLRDVNDTILAYPDDGNLSASADIGTVGSYVGLNGYLVYDYFPESAGLETFYLDSLSSDFVGTVSLEVVDTLTELFITKGGSEIPLTELSIRGDQQLDLGYLAKINGISVSANGDAVTWSIFPLEGESNFGRIDSNGKFTSGKNDAVIQLEAGGRVAQLIVTVEGSFEDITDEHWAFDAVEYLYAQGLVTGVSETRYGVGNSIRRGDFLVMLYGAMGWPSFGEATNFTDVAPEDYYYNAITWAWNNKIVSGFPDGSFGATSSITREQAIAVLYRCTEYLNIPLPTTALSTLQQYEDMGNISSYAQQAIAALTAQGVLGDSTNYVYPTADLTRESMALYLYNLLHFSDIPLTESTQLKLVPEEISLGSGQSYTLLPLLEPAGTGAEIIWSSSDPSAAKVENGVITNVFSGTGQPVVTITAKVNDNLTARCVVRCVSGTVELPEMPPLAELLPEVTAPAVPEEEVPEVPEAETVVPETEDKDTETEELETEETDTEESETEDTETEESETEDTDTEESETEDADTEESETEDTDTEESETEDTETEESETEESETEDTDTEEPETEDTDTEEPETEDTDTEEPDTEDTGASTLAQTGIVINAPGGLNVRTLPSSEGDVITRLSEGLIVSLYNPSTDEKGVDWYEISYQYTDPTSGGVVNIRGYVMADYIDAQSVIGTVINADVGLNFRSGAGTAFDVLGKLFTGDKVLVLQTFGDWYRVEAILNGVSTIGFLSTNYVEIK